MYKVVVWRLRSRVSTIAATRYIKQIREVASNIQRRLRLPAQTVL